MKRQIRSRAILLATLALAGLASAGCGDILGWLSGAYDGPRPDQDPLSGEIVILRNTPARADDRLLLDRVRYLEGGDPHNVNRVIYAVTSDVRDQVAALNLRPGDRLVISTRFQGIAEAAELNEVPNWPGHDYFEYPVAQHALTAIARAAP
jgi:hypothetical protein